MISFSPSPRFVTLDTESREDMMRVMMHVRNQTVRGEYVQARLKASAISIPDAMPPPMPYWNADGSSASFTMAPRLSMRNSENAVVVSSPFPSSASSNATKKKKRKSPKKKSKDARKNSQSSSGGNRQQQSQEHQKNQKQSNSRDSNQLAPPSLGEEEFPSLQEKKVEWGTLNPPEQDKNLGEDDGEEGSENMKASSVKSVSDAASTVTTSSSSLDSTPKKALGGYAAALLNSSPAPTKKVMTQSQSSPAPASVRRAQPPSSAGAAPKMDAGLSSTAAKPEMKPSASAPMPVNPPSWGRGRSFADILRTA